MFHQFSEVFVRAIKGEMDSMKQRLGSFELPVRCLLSCARTPLLNVESTAHLVIYPWFLYEKLISAMEELVNSQNTPGIDLAFKAFGKRKAHVGRETGILDAESGLNRSQREAVEYSLGSEVSFIWGPPGTGKTHTLARLLGEYLTQGKRILVTSTTNSAVDTVIDKMMELDLARDMRTQDKGASGDP